MSIFSVITDMKDTELGKATVQKYIEMHKKDIEKMKKKPQEINELTKPKTEDGMLIEEGEE